MRACHTTRSRPVDSHRHRLCIPQRPAPCQLPAFPWHTSTSLASSRCPTCPWPTCRPNNSQRPQRLLHLSRSRKRPQKPRISLTITARMNHCAGTSGNSSNNCSTDHLQIRLSPKRHRQPRIPSAHPIQPPLPLVSLTEQTTTATTATKATYKKRRWWEAGRRKSVTVAEVAAGPAKEETKLGPRGRVGYAVGYRRLPGHSTVHYAGARLHRL